MAATACSPSLAPRLRRHGYTQCGRFSPRWIVLHRGVIVQQRWLATVATRHRRYRTVRAAPPTARPAVSVADKRQLTQSVRLTIVKYTNQRSIMFAHPQEPVPNLNAKVRAVYKRQPTLDALSAGGTRRAGRDWSLDRDALEREVMTRSLAEEPSARRGTEDTSSGVIPYCQRVEKCFMRKGHALFRPWALPRPSESTPSS